MTNWQYEHLRFEKVGPRYACYPSRDGAWRNWRNWSIDKLGLEGVE